MESFHIRMDNNAAPSTYNTRIRLTKEADEIFQPLFDNFFLIEKLQGTRKQLENGLFEYEMAIEREKFDVLKKAIHMSVFKIHFSEQ